jgi:spore germination cell wall hydrolase CwlJ-like protein
MFKILTPFAIVLMIFIFYPVKIDKTIQVSEYKQLACMAKNIYFEAGHEPFEGKIAVAQITMNRLNHQSFPKTVCDVVYERNKRTCQFSWTCEKKTNKINQEKYVESIEAARLVMQGKASIDILKDALYYHADYVNPKWNKLKVAKIGRHIFYEPRN